MSFLNEKRFLGSKEKRGKILHYFEDKQTKETREVNTEEETSRISTIQRTLCIDREQSKTTGERSKINKMIEKFTTDIELLEHLTRKFEIDKLKSTQRPLSVAQHYIQACEKFKTEKPSLKELAEISKLSQIQCSRTMRKISFLSEVIEIIEKKINLAKREDSREFWINAKQKVGDMATNINNKNYRNRTKRLKNVDNLDVNGFGKGGRVTRKINKDND